MSRLLIKPIGEFIEERTERLRGDSATIYSVTNENGFVRSLDLFDKQVFSANTGNYKRVEVHDLAYNPSRINVGSVAICEDNDGGAVSPMYCIVRCKPGLLPRYLLRFLKSEIGLNQIRHRCEGAVRFQLKFRDLSVIPIYLPPAQEQERIMKLLDEADELRKLRVQADHRTYDLILAYFYQIFGDPISNSKKWTVVKLNTIGEWASGGTPSRTKPEYFEGDIDWYSAGELNSMFLLSSNEKITRMAIKETSAKLFRRGSLLIGMYDTAAFKMGILTNDSSSNQACANVNLDLSRCIPEWLYFNLLAMKDHFLRQRRGVRQQNLSLVMIKNFEIPLPALSLQKAFAARVEEIRALQVDQSASRKRLDDLFQSMLHRAFNGEL